MLGSYSDDFDEIDPAIVHCRLPYERTDNVCLTIDIAQSSHPFLIGTKGRKTKDLMEMSKCTINFPNLNRIPKGPKINNVMITGEVANVEEVRKELRCNTPIRLVINNFKRKPEEIRSEVRRAADERSLTNVDYQVYNDSVYLKTEWAKDVELGHLCHAVFNEGNEMYSLSIPCLSLINIHNKERNLHLLQYIKSRTGCFVYYPEMEYVSNSCPSLIIEGHDAFCVFMAARILFGLTMFQLTFDMPRNFQLSDAELKRYRYQHFVDVSIEEKTISKFGSSNCCSVVLRTFEFCSNKAYAIHGSIVGHNTHVRKTGYEFMESEVANLLPPDILESSRLYFTKQPFDPESIYNTTMTTDEFFMHFYGNPAQVSHKPTDSRVRIVDYASNRQDEVYISR